MNKRIHCSDCPLCNVEVDTLCEEYCSDMAEFVDEIRAEAYQKGKLDGAREFAEWLPTKFDLRFSNNPDVWLDEYFNHTREKVLSDYKKKNICDYDKDCSTCWSRAFCKEYNETVKGE